MRGAHSFKARPWKPHLSAAHAPPPACRYVLLWITLSATVILYNKYILTWGMFPYPVALTMWHMGFCSVLAFGIVRAGYVEPVGMSPETYLKSASLPSSPDPEALHLTPSRAAHVRHVSRGVPRARLAPASPHRWPSVCTAECGWHCLSALGPLAGAWPDG